MKLLHRCASVLGIAALVISGLVPAAQGASSTVDCNEYLDEAGSVVVGLYCDNVVSLHQLPMTGGIQWIDVDTAKGQVLGGLDVLAANPQLQRIWIDKAPQEVIPELAKLPALETLSLVFPEGQKVQLAGLGKLSGLKELEVLATSPTDYRWAKNLTKLQVLDLASYSRPEIELKVGDSAQIRRAR